MSTSSTSTIRLDVSTDDDGVTGIRWEADDSPEAGPQDAQAMILALWDATARNALRIDLWTQDMTVDDMNDFVFQTLMSLADSYRSATSDVALTGELKLFAQRFAEQASRAAPRQGRG